MTLNQFVREPLTHFFLLAALLFLVEQFFSSSQKASIIVDSATATYLIQQRQDLELKILTAAERAETIDAYIEDEILYQEAYRRGLDQGDSRMRRNLILKMRGLLTGDLGEPTEAQLRNYFTEHRERFARPATISLEQVYFEDSTTVPDELRAALNEGLNPASVGIDSFELPRKMRDLTPRYLVGTFGPEVAREIVAMDDDRWHGPFESSRGVHFLRVVERTPESQASFESVRQYLQGDWLMDQSRRVIRAEVERLRPDYRILIEADG